MDWTVSLWAKWDENFKMSFQFRDGNGFSGMKRMTQYQTRKTRVNFLPNMWSSIPFRVFYYWNTLDYLITPVFGSHSEVYYKVDRLLTNLTAQQRSTQGLVKGAILCFRDPYFYVRHGESTSTPSQLTSPASQKSKDLNKVSLLLQDLA